MSKIQRHMMYYNKSYGIIGESIPETTYKVGDLLLWKAKESSTAYESCGIAVLCNSIETNYNHPFLMGWAASDIRKTNMFTIEVIALPSKLLTQEILDHFHKDTFKIEEKEVKILTLDEVRKYVPFDFELVEGGN